MVHYYGFIIITLMYILVLLDWDTAIIRNLKRHSSIPRAIMMIETLRLVMI